MTGCVRTIFGLPANDAAAGLVILRAGDVREVLGAHAAEADGAEAGREAAARLAGRPPRSGANGIRRLLSLQTSLSRLFAPVHGAPILDDCPGDTVICRCENRTISHLKAQLSGPDTVSARELRLNGRFRHGRLPGALLLRMDAFTDVRTAPHSLSAKYRRNGRLPLAVAARSSVVARKRWHERRHTDRTAYGGDLGMTLQAR